MAEDATEQHQRENLPLLVARASSDIERQLRDSEVVDAKAFGVIAANAAIIGVIVAAHNELSQLWWLVLVVLAVDAVLLLAVIWPIKLDAGPDTRTFYEQFVTAAPLAVQQQMLTELLTAFDSNAPRIADKNLKFKTGFGLLGLGMAGAFAIALLR